MYNLNNAQIREHLGRPTNRLVTPAERHYLLSCASLNVAYSGCTKPGFLPTMLIAFPAVNPEERAAIVASAQAAIQSVGIVGHSTDVDQARANAFRAAVPNPFTTTLRS